MTDIERIILFNQMLIMQAHRAQLRELGIDPKTHEEMGKAIDIAQDLIAKHLQARQRDQSI